MISRSVEGKSKLIRGPVPKNARSCTFTHAPALVLVSPALACSAVRLRSACSCPCFLPAVGSTNHAQRHALVCDVAKAVDQNTRMSKPLTTKEHHHLIVQLYGTASRVSTKYWNHARNRIVRARTMSFRQLVNF